MALPTVESITNRYLYKQDDVINNRLDDEIISLKKSSITVDNFSLVSKIFTMEGASGITEPREKIFFANLGDGC